MNTELFKKIDDIIKATPDKFEMCSWASDEDQACGTTRCIAGWAIHLTTGEPLFDENSEEHPSVAALADRLGVKPYMEHIGRELLGLDNETAAKLFYIDSYDAGRYVDLAAQGREAEAAELLDEVEE